MISRNEGKTATTGPQGADGFAEEFREELAELIWCGCVIGCLQG
jgi:hypothetical protein